MACRKHNPPRPATCPVCLHDLVRKPKHAPAPEPESAPRKKPRVWPLSMAPCPLRGELVRQEECPVCGGRKKLVEVYACPKHGECTDRQAMPGAKLCRTCPDREEVIP